MTLDQAKIISAALAEMTPVTLTFDEAQLFIKNKCKVKSDVHRAIGNLVINKEELPLEEFAVGYRIYKIIYFIKENNGRVKSQFVIERAELLGANSDKEDCEYILDRQREIPVELLQKSTIIFTNYHNPFNMDFAFLTWHNNLLIRKWSANSDSFDSQACVVRRVK